MLGFTTCSYISYQLPHSGTFMPSTSPPPHPVSHLFGGIPSTKQLVSFGESQTSLFLESAYLA